MAEQQSKIERLVFPDNIRQNPYMMLGDLKDASLLFREILDNARDELIASKSCDKIWLKCDGEFHIVADNGRGINVAIDPTDHLGRSQMEIAVAELYAGGKYHSEIAQGGMHGIGSSAVNAVSEVFRIACKITKDNYDKSYPEVKQIIDASVKDKNQDHFGWWLLIEYNNGIKQYQRVIDYEQLKVEFDPELPDQMSTIVGFSSDMTIVRSNSVNFQTSWIEYTKFISKRYCDKDIEVILNGVSQDLDMEPYDYEVEKTVELVNPGEINDTINMYLTFKFDNDLQKSSEMGCVNLISVNKGLHIQFAQNAIAQSLKRVFEIEHNFVYSGMHLNVIFMAKKVGYDSQTKVRLTYIDGWSWQDANCINDELDAIMRSNYDKIKPHVEALNELAKTYEDISARSRIEKMININSSLGDSRTKSFAPFKLVDASAPAYDRNKCELFICEGDSAKGTIMKVRNPYNHAVMPLLGVSMNVSWQTIDDVEENEEVMDIISAIGTGIDELHDLSACRYDKIIIAADADKDGYHIAALILGIFATFMKFLVEEGKVYILQSPIYKQDGEFIYPGEEDNLDKDSHFDRFKGLGSLHATTAEGRKEIEDIFINDETRHLIQVTPENMELAIMTLGDGYTRRQLMTSRKLVKESRGYLDYYQNNEEINKAETNVQED